MVKVIGKDPDFVHTVSCDNCAALLQYVKREVKRGTAGDYSGDTWYYYYIECPECDHRVDV